MFNNSFNVHRLSWVDGKLFWTTRGYPGDSPLEIIASYAHANTLRNRALKQLFRYRQVVAQRQSIANAEWLLLEALRATLEIQPGAAYYYHAGHLGTRRVSRLVPDETIALPGQLVAMNFRFQAEARGNIVTMEKPTDHKVVATYDKQVYTKILNIVPKDLVEKSKCSNT